MPDVVCDAVEVTLRDSVSELVGEFVTVGVPVTVAEPLGDREVVSVRVNELVPDDEAVAVSVTDAERLSVVEPETELVLLSDPEPVGDHDPESDCDAVLEIVMVGECDNVSVAVSDAEDERDEVRLRDVDVEGVSDGVLLPVADVVHDRLPELVVVTVRLGVTGGVAVELSETLGNDTDVSLNETKDLVELAE